MQMQSPENRYEIVICWDDERQAYAAEVPELSGCRACGQDRVEALENAQHAIDVWVETARVCGDLVPQPHGRIQFA